MSIKTQGYARAKIFYMKHILDDKHVLNPLSRIKPSLTLDLRKGNDQSIRGLDSMFAVVLWMDFCTLNCLHEIISIMPLVFSVAMSIPSTPIGYSGADRPQVSNIRDELDRVLFLFKFCLRIHLLLGLSVFFQSFSGSRVGRQ